MGLIIRFNYISLHHKFLYSWCCSAESFKCFGYWATGVKQNLIRNENGTRYLKHIIRMEYLYLFSIFFLSGIACFKFNVFSLFEDCYNIYYLLTWWWNIMIFVVIFKSLFIKNISELSLQCLKAYWTILLLQRCRQI